LYGRREDKQFKTTEGGGDTNAVRRPL
jgi:hypothetical protein